MNLESYEIVRMADRPELAQAAAQWFHERWGIEKAAYEESIGQALLNKAAVPQWYIVMDNEKIIGGLGVIENDFHDRHDLAPNVCAVFVDPGYRGHGICSRMLEYVCNDMAEKGIDTLYLVTNHTSLYERYGWEHICMVNCGMENEPGRCYRKRCTK